MTDYELGHTRGIVFGLDQINDEQIKIIDQIVDRINGTPLTIVSNQISDFHRGAILEMGNVFSLLNPHELGDLTGVFYKMFQAVPVMARENPRHRVNLKVNFMKNQQPGTCWLTDISYGGACGIVEPECLNKGDALSLQFPILKNLKDQWFDAKVVWEAHSQHNQQLVKRIGLAFC